MPASLRFLTAAVAAFALAGGSTGCGGGATTSGCPTGLTECERACVDTGIDPENCGGCNTACGAGEVCSAGACGLSCVGGTTECGGVCVDTGVDPGHCGGCNTACGAGEVCSAGACGLSCAGGTTRCGAACVDTDYDPANCGSCGTVCSYDHGVAACLGGGCLLVSCRTGWGDCDASAANGCEAELATDPEHCGACGTACAWTEDCRTASCTLCVAGRTGLSFDGADDYVHVGDDPALDITTAISFEAWVYSRSPGTDAPILAKENSGGRQQYWFGIFYGGFGLLLGNGAGWGLSARSSGAVVADTWTHLASVWDGTTWHNFQDGVQVGTGGYAGVLPDGDEPLTIGINSGYDNTRFQGYLSDVRLWNVARTEAQIRANMCDLTDTTGLVARWMMDDGSGQTATDDSGNAFHGRLGATTDADTRDPAWAVLPVP